MFVGRARQKRKQDGRFARPTDFRQGVHGNPACQSIHLGNARQKNLEGLALLGSGDLKAVFGVKLVHLPCKSRFAGKVGNH